MPYTAGDVVTAYITFDDENQSRGPLPILIISDNSLRDQSSVYWSAMIVPRTADEQAGENEVPLGRIGSNELPSNFVYFVRPSHLLTISEREIDRRIGSVSVFKRRRIKKWIRSHV